MADLRRRWTDQQMDRLVGNVLRAGVLTAASVIALGAALYLVQEGREHPHYEHFIAPPPSLERVGDITANALHLDGKAVILFGLLILVATPVARVVLLLIVFAAQRDRRYTLITLVVLAVLLLSLTGFTL